MGSLFSPPPVPKPAPLPSPPTYADEEVQTAGEEARRRSLLASRAKTVKTSGQGVAGPAPVAVNTLLGGGGKA